MNLICFDGAERPHLLPFTFTRPAAEMRIGILSIADKWAKRLKTTASHMTADYLQVGYPLKTAQHNTLVNGSVCPTNDLADAVANLKEGQGLFSGDVLLGACLPADRREEVLKPERLDRVGYSGDFVQISRPWDIFVRNGGELERDFELLTAGRVSADISMTNTLIGGNIFAEEGAVVEAAVLNSNTGPIYLGTGSEVMEGSVVRGALALCDHATLKLGSKIYGPTTIGPHSKVGGEVSNSVIFGYSNKGHDGFLGNSVLGEWCNLGAGTSNSNLKNNYDEVRLWSYVRDGFERTGLQFCGLIMGDHSKCGINTMFNTGTVVGVSANVFGSGFPRNYIPSFAWGGHAGFVNYRIDKAMETAARVMARRGIELSDAERAVLQHVYDETAPNRSFG